MSHHPGQTGTESSPGSQAPSRQTSAAPQTQPHQFGIQQPAIIFCTNTYAGGVGAAHIQVAVLDAAQSRIVGVILRSEEECDFHHGMHVLQVWAQHKVGVADSPLSPLKVGQTCPS